MERIAAEGEVDGKKLKNMSLPVPVPSPLLLQITAKPEVKPKTPSSSVTNQEIAEFWRQKRMAEESHFHAAIKAAARIRAQNLSGDEYKAFEESLQEDEEIMIKPDKNEKEIRVGIKDWWTKSKYAYLNQPAIESMDKHSSKRRASTYISQLNCYTTAPPRATTTFSVF